LIIGIPTDDEVKVSEHFGRSKFFLIVKIESGKLIERRLHENPHNRESDDQMGHGKVLKLMTDNGVNKVICTNMGPRMVDNLVKLKIAIERCRPESSITEVLGIEAV
jgi:Uncharacterized conserved protein